MARIAAQHRNDPWRPQLPWPDDCTVQWGGRGVVLTGADSYRTAFFEVFPKDGSGGFIRGEGETVEEAERAAHDRWNRQKRCFDAGGHRWTRTRRFKSGQTRTYTNGGAFCLGCGAFQTALKPIITLGEWCKPLEVSELSLIRMGGIWPRDQERETVRFARRLWLRARAAGLALPHYTEAQFQPDGDDFEAARDRYGEACYGEVLRYYAKQVRSGMAPGPADGLAAVFDSFARNELHRDAQDAGLLSRMHLVGPLPGERR